MTPRSVRLLAAAAALLAVPGAAPAAAASTARGSFEYHNTWLFGVEQSCTESTGTVSTGCAFENFLISPSSKLSVDFGRGACAGVFSAELRVTSPAYGALNIPGTFDVNLGNGRFAGRAVVGSQVVVAELSYSGPFCAIPGIVPTDTHISGTYTVVSG